MQTFRVIEVAPEFTGGRHVLRIRDEQGGTFGCPPQLNCVPGDYIHVGAIDSIFGAEVTPSLITEALDGQRGADQQRIASTVMEWLQTILQKNADYGGSVWSVPVLAPDLSPGDAILVRMTDKINRIATLRSKGPEVAESLEDSIRDLGAYCLLWLARPQDGNSSRRDSVPASPVRESAPESNVPV